MFLIEQVKVTGGVAYKIRMAEITSLIYIKRIVALLRIAVFP